VNFTLKSCWWGFESWNMLIGNVRILPDLVDSVSENGREERRVVVVVIVEMTKISIAVGVGVEDHFPNRLNDWLKSVRAEDLANLQWPLGSIPVN